jgi:hypothetical protein
MNLELLNQHITPPIYINNENIVMPIPIISLDSLYTIVVELAIIIWQIINFIIYILSFITIQKSKSMRLVTVIKSLKKI